MSHSRNEEEKPFLDTSMYTRIRVGAADQEYGTIEHTNHSTSFQESISIATTQTSDHIIKNFLSKDKEDLQQKDYDKRNFLTRLFDCIIRRKKYYGRTIFLDGKRFPNRSFPPNVVRNQKYSLLLFVPMVLFEQFKFFFNLYFLLVALSQFIPALKVGFLFTYVGPLVFVLSITMLKEAIDDIKRWKRDKEANTQKYEKLLPNGQIKKISSSKIRVGDLIVLNVNQRVPADCILLRTSEKSGASFVRTDQLDGETDWKLRHAVPFCQKLASDDQLPHILASVYAERPKKEIYNFIGTFTLYKEDGSVEEVDSLSLENTLWANCVIASGRVLALVIYTGKETRSVMNASSPNSKVGKLDHELNTLSKLLFLLMVFISILLVALNKFQGLWYITVFRFFLLFSSIIPISLRVNLDMGKTVYSYLMMRDKKIKGTVVRNSSIPEELGRIEYFFTDKTGTLTCNEMIFKKLHMGSICFSRENLGNISSYLEQAYQGNSSSSSLVEDRRDIQTVTNMILALALCHNVTPVFEEDKMEYQASSPDEIALVKFSESVGITLKQRDLNSITLQLPNGNLEEYTVLNIFPFTSEAKRMAIFVKCQTTGEISFYMKGADTIMIKAIKKADWLEEECDNFAREGLRTLVFARRLFTDAQYQEFVSEYNQAKATVQDRAQNVEKVRQKYEKEMELLGLTGVEDTLQEDVESSLENLRNAGIRCFILTGDKLETAICIARSTRLISKTQKIFKFVASNTQEAAGLLESFKAEIDSALIIDGSSLQICLDHLRKEFTEVVILCSAVVCCRCSPTQKAEIVKLVKKRTGKRTCAIGDGGNDVNMILQADVGVGIVGKEGKQASLAADFSINQFAYVTRLILWHGRNSYKRSSRLSQFIIHRGLIISFIQAIFSSIFYFVTLPIYTGWLLVGYSTFYTMLPVFSIVLDEDVKQETVFVFPELYAELQKGRVLNFKTFLQWVWKAIYQSGVIMLLAIFLFESSFTRIVSITFTSLILTELLMVLFEVHKINVLMVLAEIFSITIYVVSIFILPTYFDIPFIISLDFIWKVLVITALSCFPIYFYQFIYRKVKPPSYAKLDKY